MFREHVDPVVGPLHLPRGKLDYGLRCRGVAGLCVRSELTRVRHTTTISSFNPEPGVVRWRIHLRSSPEAIYDLISTDAGRKRFWAKESRETGKGIYWVFPNGVEGVMKVFERSRPARFVCEYFSETKVTFEIASDGRGGTDLTLTHTGVPEREIAETTAGWGSVLMNLKAVADFSADLRNHDLERSWDRGYYDN